MSSNTTYVTVGDVTFRGVEVLCSMVSESGEAPVWEQESRTLWWTDVSTGRVFSHDTVKCTSTVRSVGRSIRVIAICPTGELTVALDDGLYALDPSSGVELLARPPDMPDQARVRSGKVDPQGRIWLGSESLDNSRPDGSLYQLVEDQQFLKTSIEAYAIDGLAFSPDGSIGYCADSGQGVVWKFHVNSRSGSVSQRRSHIELRSNEEGVPRGAAIDADGCYWLAQYNAWRIVRYDPRGRADRVVQLPIEQPTGVVFGDPGEHTIYITSARPKRSNPSLQPLAGTLLALDVRVPGLSQLPI